MAVCKDMRNPLIIDQGYAKSSGYGLLSCETRLQPHSNVGTFLFHLFIAPHRSDHPRPHHVLLQGIGLPAASEHDSLHARPGSCW